MTNTPQSSGNDEREIISTNEIDEEAAEIRRRELLAMKEVPYALTLQPKYKVEIGKKKTDYESIILQAGTRALEQGRQQCGLVIFNALLSGEKVARYNECLQTLRSMYAGKKCPENLFTEYYKHLTQYSDAQMTGPNGEVATREPELQSLSRPTPVPSALPGEPTKPVEQLSARERARLNSLKVNAADPVAKELQEMQQMARDRVTAEISATASGTVSAPVPEPIWQIALEESNRKALENKMREAITRRGTSAETDEDAIVIFIINALLNDEVADAGVLQADFQDELTEGEELDGKLFLKVWQDIVALNNPQ